MLKPSGILGVLILFLDIWAILKIIQSQIQTLNKAVWIVIIILLPILGLVIWWFFGPKG